MGSTGGAAGSNLAGPPQPANIRPELAPDQASYDASDERLRDAAQMLQQSLNAESVQEEERLWGVLIDKYEGVSAPWAADILGRAYGNRGNARSRQGKWDAALADLTRAQEICPWSVDPVLNRGVVFENTGRFGQAEADYKAVLAAAPNDPSAWNNLGNVYMATGRYAEAVAQYTRAVQLAPAFSFAAANKTLGLYAAGRTDQAMREMRGLLRRYPDFPDMRAALAAAEWGAGLGAQAEADWARVEDPRYADRNWLRGTRRWPPRLCTALEAFLDIRAVNGN